MTQPYQTVTSQAAEWDPRVWDAFVESHPDGHFLQLSGWGTLKEAFGWRSFVVGLKQGAQLVAGAQVLLRPLPGLGPLAPRFAYAPKGPLIDWRQPDQVTTFMHALYTHTRRQGALLLRMEPELRDTATHRHILAELGFSPSQKCIQPRTTVWIDLTPDEDIILARMKQKWRYNIRLAGRKGVVVREGNEADLEKFIELMQVTGERKTFGVHAPDYYRTFWRLFASEEGRALLLLAEYRGEPLAGVMVGRVGRQAYYFYGASGNRHRNLMPSHLLQWEAMRWAKRQGCTRYDLWGVPDEVGIDPTTPIPEPPTGMWGVWRFKRGFGGEIVRYVGAWDRAYYPFVLPLARRLGL